MPLFPTLVSDSSHNVLLKRKFKTSTFHSKIMPGICFKGAPPWECPLGNASVCLMDQSHLGQGKGIALQSLYRLMNWGWGWLGTHSTSWRLTSPFKNKSYSPPSLLFYFLSLCLLLSLLPQMSSKTPFLTNFLISTHISEMNSICLSKPLQIWAWSAGSFPSYAFTLKCYH